ncbi:co-chaperone GroES [Candidatus Hydrogenedentota bacterium]
MATKVEPLGDRVLVKRLEEKDTVRGGIIIPDTAKEKPMEAKIVAVGPGKLDDSGKRIKPDVKKGQIVILPKYAGTDIKIDNADHVIVRADEILAIVD